MVSPWKWHEVDIPTHSCNISALPHLDPEELIDSRLRVHDDNQVEIKLDYAIDTARARSRSHYRVETYFFVPHSLGLNSHSYPRDQFYADVQAYIRFKTPDVPLATLIDPDAQSSPLQRARRIIENANGSIANLDPEPLRRELRLLGCLARTNLRDAVADIRAKIERPHDPSGQAVLVEDVRQAIAGMLAETQQLLESFRALRPDFLRPKHPQWLRELFEYVDEYLSISAEGYLTAVIYRIDGNEALKPMLAEIRSAIATMLVAEQAHRQSAGYVSVLDPDGQNRMYVHRRSALKKFMSSVLFLEISKEKEGRRAANIFAGIAAAVAMAFSTIAAIWSQGVYGLNSFPFVVAIVISYVFKDRIKEWLRTYFSGLMSRRLYDYSVMIHDPVVGKVVGRCRESFNFVPASKVPAKIVRLRHSDSSSVLEPDTKPEVVMKYVKDVTLRSRRIGRSHGRLSDVNDIIRFNISSFLGRMDEPMQSVRTYSPDLDAVTAVLCPKAYHVNLVMVLEAEGQEASIDRFRIILDKRGIQDLQDVELTKA